MESDGQALGSIARINWQAETAAGGWVLSRSRSLGQGPPSL